MLKLDRAIKFSSDISMLCNLPLPISAYVSSSYKGSRFFGSLRHTMQMFQWLMSQIHRWLMVLHFLRNFSRASGSTVCWKSFCTLDPLPVVKKRSRGKAVTNLLKWHLGIARISRMSYARTFRWKYNLISDGLRLLFILMTSSLTPKQKCFYNEKNSS